MMREESASGIQPCHLSCWQGRTWYCVQMKSGVDIAVAVIVVEVECGGM
jgi:hypothetical protein